MDQTFKSFREASQYAACICAKYKITANLERRGDQWAVLHSEEFTEKEIKECIQDDSKRQAALKLAAEESKRRAIELEAYRKWKTNYDGLSTDELKALWDKRDRDSAFLGINEQAYLRALLRNRLGIAKGADYCPDCGNPSHECFCFPFLRQS